MTDEKTLEQLYAEHDALASNPVVQARFAQAHQLHDRPRPTARPEQPIEATAQPSPEIAAYYAAKAINPIAAANALVRGTFRK